MEEIVDICDLMNKLVSNNVTPEDMIGCALRNLHSVEAYFASVGKSASRNNIRTTTADVKLLHDYGQQMSLARTYLLHKIKLLEVRENDYLPEISLLRGITPPVGQELSLLKEGHHRTPDKSCLHEQVAESDPELEIILDTRMINEIDLSKAALQDINKRIADKKNALLDIEKQMDDVSNSIFSSVDRQGLSEELEHNVIRSSSRVERTRDFEASNRPRAGDPRTWSPKLKLNMAMSQGSEINLPSQGALGSPRDQHGGAPDAAGSTVLGRESGEGTVGVVSASAPADQVATAEDTEFLIDDVRNTREEYSEETIIPATGEKRKATSSPGEDTEEAEPIGVRRPNKARVIDSVEDENRGDTVVVEESCSISEVEEVKENIASPLSSLEGRVIRGTARHK